jgi:hypothetical protein
MLVFGMRLVAKIKLEKHYTSVPSNYNNNKKKKNLDLGKNIYPKIRAVYKNRKPDRLTEIDQIRSFLLGRVKNKKFYPSLI